MESRAGSGGRPAEFWDPAVQRLMLRTLIDQRILIQEAAKLPATRVTDEEIAAARGELVQNFNTPDDSTRFESRQRLVVASGPRLEGHPARAAADPEVRRFPVQVVRGRDGA
ncbi:MAG: hypothetical protein IPF82_02600 [Blastocatellia bacterium]|nr:hypothetical protein [Blastocatellia bacterium]